MGTYVVCEVGAFNTLNNFTIDQITTLYTAEIYRDAVKTEITVDYLNTLFGANYPIDLSTFAWEVAFLTQTPTWGGVHCDGYTISGNTLTYYNLVDTVLWEFRAIGYAGFTPVLINVDGLTEIKLDAKSLEVEYLWTEGGIPVVGKDVELFWFNGTGFELVGTYITDINGLVTITQQLIIGTYKINSNPIFDIVISDVVKTLQYSMESNKEIFSISYFFGFLYLLTNGNLLINKSFFYR